jgi:hypothetical protein
VTCSVEPKVRREHGCQEAQNISPAKHHFRFQVQDSTPNRQLGLRKTIAAKAKTFLHELHELTRIDAGHRGKAETLKS